LIVAKAGSAYPQVTVRAAALATGRVIAARPGLTVQVALARLDAAGAQALALGRGRVARRTELERARRWGLDRLAAGDLAWGGVPAVAGAAPESRLRRVMARGAPIVLLTERRRAAAIAERERVRVAPVEGSLARRLEATADAQAEARLWLLRTASKAGESLGSPAYLVGGSVRDLLLGRASPDLDLAVEGDALRFAARLADEVGGRLVRHPAFGTASIEEARSMGGAPLGRIDIAATRRERYEAPGQLPRVSPASMDDDLGRRDLTINAMAVCLSPACFGRLVDPHGGQADLARRRLRPLHPLSFVEDPTRIFRAARYGARLRLRLSEDGRRALTAALRAADLTGGFPALTGPRLAAELYLVAEETSGWQAFDRLARWGALRLWDPVLCGPRATRALRAAAGLDAWSRRAGVRLDRGELVLLAMLVDQAPDAVGRCLARLGVTGAPRTALAEAVAGARAMASALAPRGLRPSEVARQLRRRPAAAALGAWLVGGRRARRRVERFMAGGQAVQASLRGGDLVALGVPEGPDVGTVLEALCDARLDGRLCSSADERALVRAWLAGEKGDPT
jgi:tRNA nucleotidyltransferase (CCA-adding enzyme)